jgi:hypothetical protein
MAGGGTLFIGNNYDSADRKVYGIGGMGIQFASAGTLSSPTKFSSIMLIGSSATFFSEAQYSVFSMYDYDAPDFGSGSFMGFKTVQGNYGWLEVTWTGSTNQFQILGGAYESVAGEPILTPTAIPEPASVLSTMGLLASGLLIRRRKRAA